MAFSAEITASDRGWMCSRSFSDLGEWQKPCTVVYRLEQEQEQENWVLHIEQTQAGVVKTAVSAEVNASQEQAFSLLSLLYENAVQPVHGLDVLADQLPAERWSALDDRNVYE